MSGRYWLIVLPALAACDHGPLFRPTDYGSGGPFSPGSPTRLTYSPGIDGSPAWLPDESGILYSFQRLDRPDHDVCIGLLPPAGGTREREICNRDPAADNTINVYDWPAVSAGGRLVYARKDSASPLAPRPFLVAMVFGTLAAPELGPVLQSLPGVPGGVAREPRQLRWLSDSALVYIAWTAAEGLTPARPLALVRVDLTGGTPTFRVFPGTENATSVAVSPSGDSIYYTLAGDRSVYLRVLSIGATAVAHDFGATGIPTNVQVRGTRLAAIIGGSIYLVDLATNIETLLPGAGFFFTDLTLSRSGRHLVAVARADLWLFELP